MISELLNKNKYRVRLTMTLINTTNLIIAYLRNKEFWRLIKTLKPFEYNNLLIIFMFGSINCSITTRSDLFELIKVAILDVLYTFIISYKSIQYCMYVMVENQIIVPT